MILLVWYTNESVSYNQEWRQKDRKVGEKNDDDKAEVSKVHVRHSKAFLSFSELNDCFGN